VTPDLSRFSNAWYDPGRSLAVRALWFFCGLPLVRSRLVPGSGWRRAVLRSFGARIGPAVVIKPGVRVKYPWLLSVGAHSWIGEEVWIDNLAPVAFGDNVCVSQGAYLGTGNHDWTDPAFGLVVRPVTLGNGAWVGARALICPGVTVGECGVAASGSVVAKSIPPREIHAGNPAAFVRMRRIKDELPADQPVFCA